MCLVYVANEMMNKTHKKYNDKIIFIFAFHAYRHSTHCMGGCVRVRLVVCNIHFINVIQLNES